MGLRKGMTLVLAVVCLAGSAWGAPGVNVKIESGEIAGVAQGEVISFQGIPFAAAPTGSLRWREPQPPAHWAGVREPLAAVPACVQPVMRKHLPWTAEYLHRGTVSEDCLFLNVWKPNVATRVPIPVLVYIYGGGFNQGSISVPLYDGAALARKGIIVVTVSYRVGVLGFMAHPELTRESPNHSSGNYGLLDQVAALRWVHDNIRAFDGDPGRVTVFGQSAGAVSVYLMTASPLTKGLFQRAIVQSGPGALAAFGESSLKAMTLSRAAAEQTGERFAASLGVKSIAQLRAVDAQRLLAATAAWQPGAGRFHFGPDVDGWFLTADAETVYAQHQQYDVPLIIGMMADEGSAFPGYTGAHVTEVREKSIAGVDQVLAQRAAAGGGVAYAYYFERAIPWPEHPQFKAFHSGELPYVFDNQRLLKRPWTDADRELASVVSSYWVNFASLGDPNGNQSGLPQWLPYKPGSRTFMVLGETVGEKNLTP
jgi:para-nitrobenzyl esterase